LQNSLENIYGLIDEGGETADHMMIRVPAHLGEDNVQSVQRSERSYYLNSKQLMTNMINPVNNTTTEFFTEEGYQFLPNATGRINNDVGGLLVTDFEEHAANSSSIEIHHHRALSNHQIID
jgi:hypothetical protein